MAAPTFVPYRVPLGGTVCHHEHRPRVPFKQFWPHHRRQGGGIVDVHTLHAVHAPAVWGGRGRLRQFKQLLDVVDC